MSTTTLLVPGAWMGSWIWEPTARDLRERDISAEAVTLPGLEPGTAPSATASVTLRDHVDDLAARVARVAGDVILVGHSYSSMVTAQVADRMPDRVIGLVHVGGFLPVDGASLLDGWGGSDEDRRQEKADIAEAGDLWAAPTREMLEYEVGLSASNRACLAARLIPHPGRTVLDHAELSGAFADQPTTYVALSAVSEERGWADAPRQARDATGWRRRYIGGGHWPMLSRHGELVDLLAAEIEHHATHARAAGAAASPPA